MSWPIQLFGSNLELKLYSFYDMNYFFYFSYTRNTSKFIIYEHKHTLKRLGTSSLQSVLWRNTQVGSTKMFMSKWKVHIKVVIEKCPLLGNVTPCKGNFGPVCVTFTQQFVTKCKWPTLGKILSNCFYSVPVTTSCHTIQFCLLT